MLGGTHACFGRLAVLRYVEGWVAELAEQPRCAALATAVQSVLALFENYSKYVRSFFPKRSSWQKRTLLLTWGNS